MNPADLALTICPGPTPEAATVLWATGWSTFILEHISSGLHLPARFQHWPLDAHTGLSVLWSFPPSLQPSLLPPPSQLPFLPPSFPSFFLLNFLFLFPPSSLLSHFPLPLIPCSFLLPSLPSLSSHLGFPIRPSCLVHSLYVSSPVWPPEVGGGTEEGVASPA